MRRIRWCVVHGSQAHLPPQPEGDPPDGLEGSPEDICLHALVMLRSTGTSEASPCRMVPMRLIPEDAFVLDKDTDFASFLAELKRRDWLIKDSPTSIMVEADGETP